jgi:hypothetical protein
MGIKIGIPGGDAPALPAVAPAEMGSVGGGEEQDVQMIDQAIEQIKAGDSAGAISTLEALKGNEQGEVAKEGQEGEMPGVGLSPALMSKIQSRFGKK